jgi:hypothetical protein
VVATTKGGRQLSCHEYLGFILICRRQAANIASGKDEWPDTVDQRISELLIGTC